MTVLPLLMILAVLAAAGFVLGRQRALALAGGETRKLHSLPAYYGWHAAIMAFVPAFFALIVWLLVQPFFIGRAALDQLPAAVLEDSTASTLAMADVRRIAAGLDVAVSRGALTEAGIDGALEPVPVRAGEVIGDRTVIREGLKAGDTVVVAGAFAVKSQMLKAQLGEGHGH